MISDFELLKKERVISVYLYEMNVGKVGGWILGMGPNYKEMLKRLYSKLPPEVFEHKRFELPRSRSAITGARTILFNFKEICDVLNRDPDMVLRFLSKEMATAGTLDRSRAIFQGRFRPDTLEKLLKRYVDEFVMCPICERPDTKIVKEKRLYFLVCEACGARSSIRPT